MCRDRVRLAASETKTYWSRVLSIKILPTLRDLQRLSYRGKPAVLRDHPRTCPYHILSVASQSGHTLCRHRQQLDSRVVPERASAHPMRRRSAASRVKRQPALQISDLKWILTSSLAEIELCSISLMPASFIEIFKPLHYCILF